MAERSFSSAAELLRSHLAGQDTQAPVDRRVLFAKAHNKGYTRSDGTYVAAFDDKRSGAKPGGATVAPKKAAPSPAETPAGGEYGGIAPHVKAKLEGYSAEELASRIQAYKTAGAPKAHVDFAEKILAAKRAGAGGGSGDANAGAGGGAGAVEAVPHPKGHKVGGSVTIPGANGKRTVGKYLGQRGGKSVVDHPKLGQVEVGHDDVKGVPGASKGADPAASKAAGDDVRAAQAFVQEHYDRGHPHVVGKMAKRNQGPETGKTFSFEYGGQHYGATNKKGECTHDGRDVHEFRSEDGSHRLWGDDKGFVHADSRGEVAGLRAKYEAGLKGRARG